MDQMMELMDKHTNHLEELVYDRTRQLHEEKQRDEIEFKLKILSDFFLLKAYFSMKPAKKNL